jgi:prepilin-type N-terminal cleavage/methylation domain-containing protein
MRRGFTLVELVIVAAVMAVISAIAIPQYGAAMANFRVKAAARRLVSDLAMAQASARSGSVSRPIDFDPATGSYTIGGISGLDGAATYNVSLKDDPYRSTFAVTLTGAGVANRLTFSGYGWPDRAANIVITSGTAKRTVATDASTGAASIQ